MEREKVIIWLKHSWLLKGECSLGTLKDTRKGDYYFGCTECGRPVKIQNSGEIKPKRIRQKGSPNC
jgi:hypothetical protein